MNNKMIWAGVSLTLLASLQAAAEGDMQLAIQSGEVQSISKTTEGHIVLIGKNGKQLVLDKKIVEALKKADLNSVPSFNESNPCVAFKK